MKPQIPSSLKAEHDELHGSIQFAESLSGKTAEEARKVAKLLHPHFVKEEEFALPSLGLLPALAFGKVTLEMRSVLKMTNKLKAEYQDMLAEHIQIVAALNELTEAARKEDHPEIVSFAQKLMLHAKTEEEVMYPMAIVIGEYIKAKLSSKTAPRKNVRRLRKVQKG